MGFGNVGCTDPVFRLCTFYSPWMNCPFCAFRYRFKSSPNSSCSARSTAAAVAHRHQNWNHLTREKKGNGDSGHLFLAGIAVFPRGQVLRKFRKMSFKMFPTKQPASLAFRIISCFWKCIYLEIQNDLYLQL